VQERYALIMADRQRFDAIAQAEYDREFAELVAGGE
jgi:hypothetical protein